MGGWMFEKLTWRGVEKMEGTISVVWAFIKRLKELHDALVLDTDVFRLRLRS